ncbi:hypothetical protein AB0I66_08570, partial [Streptomyces sp. NPDC050439]|uniref:hypothetical protein n=1 Tax=unclassified Streptomyces TaxID=2593676 RepID=UPI003442971A
ARGRPGRLPLTANLFEARHGQLGGASRITPARPSPARGRPGRLPLTANLFEARHGQLGGASRITPARPNPACDHPDRLPPTTHTAVTQPRADPPQVRTAHEQRS